MLEGGCIKGTWCREYKRKKKIKCKGHAEDNDADREEQCNKITIGLVRH